jgi:hypothetical protein
MLDDLICPTCQVLLRPGTNICAKCGRRVEPAKTHVPFIDWTPKLYAPLVHHLGPVWGSVVVVAVFILLLALFVGLVVLKSILRP